MTCRLKGTLRAPERLVGRLTGTRLTGPDGLYLGGIYQGVVDGYYVDNEPALIPGGCYRNGGLVDPYYERIRDAALAEGGGLYLFQLEHGQYAGEQVIWQDAAGTTPWEPGLGTPQGKTMDLMGSGEFLSQSVSMRRPVDGVWDGVGTWMDAASMDVGNKLHQSTGSAWFAGLEIITYAHAAAILSSASSTSSLSVGIIAQNRTEGITSYRRNGVNNMNLSANSLGLVAGISAVAGESYGAARKIYLDAAEKASAAAYPPYPDTPADHVLRVGATVSGASFIHARYTYIAIYTREPTEYEISLHKRTP